MPRPNLSRAIRAQARRRVAVLLLVAAAIATGVFVSAGLGCLFFLVALGIGALGGGPPTSDPSGKGSSVPGSWLG